MSEEFASDVLVNVKDAMSTQGTTVVATALREERRMEVEARLKKEEKKQKKWENKLELAILEQV